MIEARFLKHLLVLAAVAPAALLSAGCGGESDSHKGKFDVKGSVDRFAGPTPLITRFDAEAKNATGDVIYRWRFDDGTASSKPSVAHSFGRAGYYQVILDARDEAGNNDRETFLLGVWPRAQWTRAMGESLTPARARAAQEVQQRRTDVRHTEIRKRLRRLAREQIEG